MIGAQVEQDKEAGQIHEQEEIIGLQILNKENQYEKKLVKNIPIQKVRHHLTRIHQVLRDLLRHRRQTRRLHQTNPTRLNHQEDHQEDTKSQVQDEYCIIIKIIKI